MSEPLLLREIDDARAWVHSARAAGASIGIVPTMGALHEGHLSLVRAARAENDRVAVTVFVNPTQFSPSEDYERYPRDLEADLAALAELGVDAVFAPPVEAMYPPGAETSIDVGAVAQTLEGAQRPTHFAGVATVVMKLFGVLPAHRAYFGQKDYQQTVVIRRMVDDLNCPIEVVVCPIVREPDGLAMSSRNVYLSPEQRESALVLPSALRSAAQMVAEGQHEASVLKAHAQSEIEAAEGVDLDYVEVVRDGTVTPVEHLDGPAVMVVAARVGRTRLIDNTRFA